MHTAIVLAGGKSSRLGIDKAFLRFNNRYLIEIVICKLVDFFDQIIVVANDNIEKYNEIINNPKIIIKDDLIKGKGPLGGIHTGLKTAKSEYCFVLACDMPFVNADLIRHMLGFNGFDAVVPMVDNFIEPLCAVYSKNNLELIKEQIERDDLKLLNFINRIKKIRYIEKVEIEKFDKERLCFFNVNDKDDLEKARDIVK